MNMKKWITPMAMEECFTANVDVAVSTCYKVACNAPAANAYEKEHRQGLLGWYCPDHTDYYCTDSTKNVIKVDSNTHKIIGMEGKYEHDVQCQFTTPDYQQTIDTGDLKVGQTVYWTSPGFLNQFNGSKYHHQGTLQLADLDKKLMS